MSATEEQKVLLELFKKFHVQASLSITEIREITAKVFVELEVRSQPIVVPSFHRGAACPL